MNIAYLGIAGSFSHLAAIRYFGKKHRFLSCKTVKDVFTRKKDYGIVPLENSLHGNVVEAFDLLDEYNTHIIGEVYLSIRHCLLGILEVKKKDPLLKKVKRCLSHWQAISQCESFFESHPWIEKVFATDTATAARQVALENSVESLAIAGKVAARIYGLEIIKENIEKNRENYTRFGIISKKGNKRGNKISLSFSVKHIPGSLLKALTPYAENGLNLLQIESRPIQSSPWEYTFFLDLAVGYRWDKAQNAIRQMRKVTNSLKILGIYNKGKVYET